MPFEKGPDYMGYFATISHRNEQGEAQPVLSVVRAKGRLDDAVIDAAVANMISVLNGHEPIRGGQVRASRIGWERQSTGFIISFQRGEALNTKDSMLALFNAGAPPELMDQVYNTLAEDGGMGRLMDQFQVIAPGHGPKPAPAMQGRH